MRATFREEWSSDPPVMPFSHGSSPKGSMPWVLASLSMSSGVSRAAMSRRVLFWRASRVPFSSRVLNRSRACSKWAGVSRSLTAKSGWARTWAMFCSRR
jgi:hypothetical protein